MQEKEDLSRLIDNYLIKLSFKIKSVGFEYIKKAIMLCYENNELLDRVTKNLYPTVGNNFGVTGAMVERSIRHAIEEVHKESGFLELNTIFDALIYRNDYRFSNSELISLIVSKLKIDLNKDKILKKYNLELPKEKTEDIYC